MQPDLSRLHIRSGPGEGIGAWTVIAIGLAGLAIGGTGHWAWGRATAAPPVPVTTAVVRPPGAATGAALVAGGWIEAARPEQPVAVPAQVPERITAILVKEGDEVAPGAEIATLYDLELAKQAAEAKARVAHAEAALRFAEANAGRIAELKDLASRDQAERASAEVGMASAALAEARAAHALAELRLSFTSITAPPADRPWRVLKLWHRVGDTIAPDSGRTVAELYDPSRLQARVDVPQRQIRSIRVGAAVEVRTDAAPDRTYAGKVLRIEPLADQAKNTLTVRIALDAPDDMLFPEMTCTVGFLPDASAGGERPLVPRAAVRRDADGAFVLVERGGLAVAQRFTAGAEVGPWLAVADGLASGERVVLDDVAPGARIAEAP